MHKYYRYLFLLPIAILIASSIYFDNLSNQIEAAMQQEKILRNSNLSNLLSLSNYGEAVLIIITALLNIAMVLIIIRRYGKKHG